MIFRLIDLQTSFRKQRFVAFSSGITAPTSGTAQVGEHDVVKELDAVKQSLGICPQFDCLFEQLTVEEHLKFYAKVRATKKRHVTSQR